MKHINKLSLILLLTVLVITSCKKNNNSGFSLKGTVDNVELGKAIMLIPNGNGKPDTIGIAQVIDHKFEIKTSQTAIDGPTNCKIVFWPEVKDVTVATRHFEENVIVDNKPMEYHKNANQNVPNIIGSEWHDKVYNIQKYNAKLGELYGQLKEKQELLDTDKRGNYAENRKNMIEAYTAFSNYKKDVIEDVLKTSDDLTYKAVLLQAYNKLVAPHLYLIAVNEVMAGFGESHHLYKSLINNKKVIEQSMKINVGNPLIDFVAEDMDGKEVHLSDIANGKYVLLDFWASWCGPCKKEIPNLKKLYERFNKKGFEVFMVSVDAKKERWVRAAEQLELSWISTLDVNQAKELYVISKVPTNFLLGPDGLIIGIDLHGKELEDKLSGLLD